MNIATLDFAGMVERIVSTYNYDACLFGTVGVSLDPSTDADIWLSSGSNHFWNPKQRSPETRWEAEVDDMMRRVDSVSDEKQRKASFDRVQEILYEQEPILFLVSPNALSAVSPVVRGVRPVVLRPQLLWNAESLEVVRQQ